MRFPFPLSEKLGIEVLVFPPMPGKLLLEFELVLEPLLEGDDGPEVFVIELLFVEDAGVVDPEEF